jgi:hypothetical protein
MMDVFSPNHFGNACAENSPLSMLQENWPFPGQQATQSTQRATWVAYKRRRIRVWNVEDEFCGTMNNGYL